MAFFRRRFVAFYGGEFLEAVFENKASEGTVAKEEAKKKIALTFDDGPNAVYTPILLEGLKKRGVKATFFLLGTEIEKNPALVKQMDKEGHLLGVHSYKHVNFGHIDTKTAVLNITKTKELIEEQTNKEVLFIRPPYGCWKKELDKTVPLVEVLWDVDPLDWATDSTWEIEKRVLDKVHDGCIILLHDASKSSVQAAFDIIDCLQREGYKFVTVEDLILGY